MSDNFFSSPLLSLDLFTASYNKHRISHTGNTGTALKEDRQGIKLNTIAYTLSTVIIAVDMLNGNRVLIPPLDIKSSSYEQINDPAFDQESPVLSVDGTDTVGSPGRNRILYAVNPVSGNSVALNH